MQQKISPCCPQCGSYGVAICFNTCEELVLRCCRCSAEAPVSAVADWYVPGEVRLDELPQPFVTQGMVN